VTVAIHQFDRAEAIALTDRIRESVERTWELIAEAHEHRVWELLGYASWDTYVKAEFDISRGQGYRLLNRARVIKELSDAAGVPVEVTGREAERIKGDLPSAVSEISQAVTSIPKGERPAAVQAVVAALAPVPAVPQGNAHLAEQGQPTDGNESVTDIVASLRATILSLSLENDRLTRENATFRAENARLHEQAMKLKSQVAAGAKPSPKTPGCMHPITRRIDHYCGACGATVK